MQKFMASKLAGSSVGQDMIASVVDDTTRNIISALILSIKKCNEYFYCFWFVKLFIVFCIVLQ